METLNNVIKIYVPSTTDGNKPAKHLQNVFYRGITTGENKNKLNNKTHKAMKTINKNTKAGKRFINAYNRSRKSSIYECYRNPSTAKARAEYLCRDMMSREDGHGYKITGYNCMQFTAMWTTPEGLRVEMAASSYIVK